MNQLVAKETLKGLLQAPVPACSCAKGLAVGAVHAWDALQELANLCGLSHGSKPGTNSTQESCSAHLAAPGRFNIAAGAATVAHPAPDLQAAAAAAQSAPPELFNETDGRAAQKNTF
jgi:hypothetical protein